jgi:hypothetical protein
MSIQNVIAITVTYKGPTNHKGSRVKLGLPAFGLAKTIPYNYSCSGGSEGTALAYLAERGITVEASADLGKSTVLLVSSKQASALRAAL